MILALALPLGLALLTLAGCETTTSGGAVGADRSQLMLVSSSELDQMAAQGYAKLVADAGHAGTLNRDSAMLKRVRSVAGRITAPVAAVSGSPMTAGRHETTLQP